MSQNQQDLHDPLYLGLIFLWTTTREIFVMLKEFVSQVDHPKNITWEEKQNIKIG